MKKKNTSSFEKLLKDSGFKATVGRIGILQILEKEKKPMSISEVEMSLGKRIDQTTVYRNLEALEKVGVVKKISFQKNQSFYEFVKGGEHHHHLVCKKCGLVEDVNICLPKGFEKKILERSKYFSEIKDHSLEFFGLCRKCG